MNVGDLFQRMSNSKRLDSPPPVLYTDLIPFLPDSYPSGMHRVSVSGRASGRAIPARYSIPYFVGPAPDGIIEPQPSLVAAVGKKHHEPIKYQKFSEQIFDTTNIYDLRQVI